MENVRVGRINLNRQQPYLDGRHIDELIDKWLDDCADRLDDLAADGSYCGTTAGYAAKIVYFREWWADVGEEKGWKLSQALLREFERWLRRRPARYGGPLAYHTRRDSLRRLRAMLRWAQMQGYIVGLAPADWVPAPAGDPPARTLVSDGALVRLMRAAELTAHPARNSAILSVLIGTGVRRRECAMLRVEDVRMDADLSGSILVRAVKRTKRGKVVRTVVFDSTAGAYLDRWLDLFGAIEGPLFPSQRTGDHLSARSLGRIVRQCWDMAGLTADQPCHDLRRKFITDWRKLHRNAGADADHLLQLQVGHADGSMTTQYSLQGPDDVRQVFSSPMRTVPPPTD